MESGNTIEKLLIYIHLDIRDQGQNLAGCSEKIEVIAGVDTAPNLVPTLGQ